MRLKKNIYQCQCLSRAVKIIVFKHSTIHLFIYRKNSNRRSGVYGHLIEAPNFSKIIQKLVTFWVRNWGWAFIRAWASIRIFTVYTCIFFFSDDFHKSLRELLAKLILENLSAWRMQAINNQGSVLWFCNSSSFIILSVPPSVDTVITILHIC